ncbi:MAG: AtpZ/AtpI family protein [Crocinitomicaceae bacterium]|nr:AtpZ/AtpI family protein [Crocinitomicaceae bacterium]
MRFAGIGLQMGVIITAGALFGNYLDENQNNEKPIYALVFSLIGVFIGLYLVIREALKIGKK